MYKNQLGALKEKGKRLNKLSELDYLELKCQDLSGGHNKKEMNNLVL